MSAQGRAVDATLEPGERACDSPRPASAKHEDGSAPSVASRITLLTDPCWPAGPGVSRWRVEFAAMATAVGVVVDIVEAPMQSSECNSAEPADRRTGPSDPPASTAARARPQLKRARRLAGRLRDLVTDVAAPRKADNKSVAPTQPPRRAEERVPTAVTPFQPRALLPAPPGLAGALSADLVLAESPQVASAVLEAVELRRLWCLVLPPERAARGENPTWAAPLRQLCGRIGGFVTDSLEARDIVERALSHTRATVVIVPPFAKSDDRPLGRVVVEPMEPAPDDSAFAPAQLEVWAAMLAGREQQIPPELLYAARRLTLAPPEPVRDEVLVWNPDVDLTPGAANPRTAAEPAVWPADPSWSEHLQRTGVRDILRLLPERPGKHTRAAPLRVGVIGFDLKFMRELGARLDLCADLAVEFDEWPGPNRRNGTFTEDVVREAQTLVAEWARPNAVWLSQVKRPDQRLIVRLHRFELTTGTPAQIQIDNLDAVVYIAPVCGQRIRDELGWPEEKLVYLPNFVDVGWLDRPKFDGSRFTLALLGAALRVKRLDLALDLLARVRAENARFTLIVRSAMPYELSVGWRKPDERRFFHACMERIEKDPLLRGAVHFDGSGRDIAAWLRGAGHILSLSDKEGSHSALSEGMASGAVPVVRRWHGVGEMYSDEWIREDLDDAARFVLESADEAIWWQRSKRAREEMRRKLAPLQVVEAWRDLLHGDLSTAVEHFGRKHW